MVAQESTAQKDKEIIISIVKEMTESMTGAQSTRHWAEDALWFDIPPFASRGIPGQQTVLDRLLDVLLVMAMRASFEQSSTAPRWYRAASEPRLGRALQAMHDKPERAWTVTELAHLSAMSRPSFARNFERALGQSPMQYLTEWRLTLARDYLVAGELTLEQIADRVGYGSTNAFSAAFRRHVGLAPGLWRQQHSLKPSIST